MYTLGALDGRSICHMSNLRNVNLPYHLNGHVPCRLYDALMSPVELKKHPMSCPLSFFLMSLGPMSHVKFKKYPCCRVEYRGQGPYLSMYSGTYTYITQLYLVCLAVCQYSYGNITQVIIHDCIMYYDDVHLFTSLTETLATPTPL